jgi:hypothetical protein
MNLGRDARVSDARGNVFGEHLRPPLQGNAESLQLLDAFRWAVCIIPAMEMYADARDTWDDWNMRKQHGFKSE